MPALTRPQWPRPAASAAVFRDGRVLIVERGKGALRGVWSLPGGHIEPGERAMAAAMREIKEETGVDAALLGLADVHDVLLRNESGELAAHYVIAVYFGRWLSGEPVANEDSRDARFVALDQLETFNMTPGALPIIARARELLEALADR